MKNFIIEGVEFAATADYDYGMREPWVERDGYGVLVQGRSDYAYPTRTPAIKKSPGQVHIGKGWLYDVTASVKVANEQGLNLSESARLALARQRGREPTAKEVIAEAVALDMEFCKSYLQGRVRWHNVVVHAVDEPDNTAAVSGVLCQWNDIQELLGVACELSQELLYCRSEARAEAAKLLDAHYAGL